MTTKSDERVRAAYLGLPYTRSMSDLIQEIGDLKKDRDRLTIALGEAVKQNQGLNAQLDYLRGLKDNLGVKVDYAGNPITDDWWD